MPVRGREGVFSSTGFRIRAAQPAAATASVVRWAEHFAASVFFTLFPANCRICGSPLLQVSRLPVCCDCLSSLRPLSGALCTVCGEGLHYSTFRGQRSSAEPAAHLNSRCRLCEQVRPPFERAVAYGSYESALRDLIHLLKFDQVRPAAPVLGSMLAESIANLESSLPTGIMAVVPVPLHARKETQRGFNQAELIARAALKKLAGKGIGNNRFELCSRVLVRLRDTGSQIGLSRHQRRRNLRGAFAVIEATSILNRDVLVVDDVYTTGATAAECARVLRRAGAARVWVATVGRTMRVPNSGIEMVGISEGWDEADIESVDEGREAKSEEESVGIRVQG